jgi:hypothetical protein
MLITPPNDASTVHQTIKPIKAAQEFCHVIQPTDIERLKDSIPQFTLPRRRLDFRIRDTCPDNPRTSLKEPSNDGCPYARCTTSDQNAFA